MWQRSQTLYFGLATILVSILIFSNIATVYAEGQTEGVRFLTKLPYAVLGCLSGLACLLCTFSWRHRILQMRAGIASAVVLLGLQVWLAVDYFSVPEGIVFRYTAIFPVVAMVLDLMAVKGVYADELLVRSSARLRSVRRKKEDEQRKLDKKKNGVIVK